MLVAHEPGQPAAARPLPARPRERARSRWTPATPGFGVVAGRHRRWWRGGGSAMQPDGGMILDAPGRRADRRRVASRSSRSRPEDATTTGPVGFNRAGERLPAHRRWTPTPPGSSGWTGATAAAPSSPRTRTTTSPTCGATRRPANRRRSCWTSHERGSSSLDPALDRRPRSGCRRSATASSRSSRPTTPTGRGWSRFPPSDGPIRYSRVRPRRRRGDVPLRAPAALEDYELAPMEPFSFAARDGLDGARLRDVSAAASSARACPPCSTSTAARGRATGGGTTPRPSGWRTAATSSCR